MQTPSSSTRTYDRLFLGVFTLSGFAGLAYEIIWVRQFATVLGSSAYALTTILAAFMAGLGLGGWLIGKVSDRCTSHALARLYIILEVGVGVYALGLPHLLGVMETVYVGLYQVSTPTPVAANLLRLALSFVVLLLPATFMGGTLPVVSRYIVRSNGAISTTVSQLYAFNTFGAVLGTVATGFYLLPHFGVAGTSLIAVLVDFGAAIAFWSLHHLRAVAPEEMVAPAKASYGSDSGSGRSLSAQERLLIAAYAVSGAAAMLYEIAWTRSLSLILGTTTYAFTTMLATFIAGLALGSAAYKLLKVKVPHLTLFCWLQWAVCFSVLLTIPALEKLPFVYLLVRMQWIDSWADLQYVRFVLAALVMIVPVFAMGMLFPVVTSIFVKHTKGIGGGVGKVYGYNTLGGVVGSVAGGLVLVPLIGMQKTLMAGAALNLLAGAVVYLTSSHTTWNRRMIEACAICTCALLIMRGTDEWAPKVMNSGVYIYGARYANAVERYARAARGQENLPQLSPFQIWEMAMNQPRLLYYNTGVSATVAVMENADSVRFLTVNGKTDAGTGRESDLRTEVMLGQLPFLIRPNARDALMVGLGSGISAGSALTHPLTRLDCAEIAPAIVEACKYFGEHNHDVLNDPRLRVVQRDARNLLLTTGRSYDVIISQPSNPWVEGESSLFTLDWYELVWDHLNEGGLFAQWLPTYMMSERDVKTIIYTLKTVFPSLTLWTSGTPGDLYLLAHKGDGFKIDFKKFQRAVRIPEVRADLERVGQSPEKTLFELFVMNRAELSHYLSRDGDERLRKNTDNRLVTEFSTPKRLVDKNVVDRLVDFDDISDNRSALAPLLVNRQAPAASSAPVEDEASASGHESHSVL